MKPGFRKPWIKTKNYYLVGSRITNIIHIRKVDDYQTDFICGIDGELNGVRDDDRFITCPDCAKIYLALEKV